MKKTGETYACANCGDDVYVPKWKQEKSSTGRFYCDKDCHDEHQQEYQKNIQREMSDGEYRECVMCGDNFWCSPSDNQLHCSPKCANSNPEVNARKGAKAEKNGKWRGGVDDSYHQRLAEENLEKECVECGSTENLDVHHKNGDIKITGWRISNIGVGAVT